LGGTQFGSGLFVGYTKETALEEGLQAFQVDDITLVNMEGLSIAQKTS
jgi:hypothetical protein